ncbi:hypothetical protein LIA77_00827 [Sarocladium implicatum]|nr:hypothetical protein LIA77_00827 [Sarocladium implicatum]
MHCAVWHDETSYGAGSRPPTIFLMRVRTNCERAVQVCTRPSLCMLACYKTMHEATRTAGPAAARAEAKHQTAGMCTLCTWVPHALDVKPRSADMGGSDKHAVTVQALHKSMHAGMSRIVLFWFGEAPDDITDEVEGRHFFRVVAWSRKKHSRPPTEARSRKARVVATASGTFPFPPRSDNPLPPTSMKPDRT